MSRLIDDLLAYSRMGRMEMHVSLVDMTALARSVFFEVTPQGDQGRIEFLVHDLPAAQGDPLLLRQVWMNLLDNAVKFSAKCEQAVIEVGWLPGNGDVPGSRAPQNGASPPVGGPSTPGVPDEVPGPVYFVRDNGAGFDMTYRQALRGLPAAPQCQGVSGTGVGLAIAQRIVRRHNGRIWATGMPGQGATFFFTLGIGETRNDLTT
jgi:signal transduction histidine kinase